MFKEPLLPRSLQVEEEKEKEKEIYNIKHSLTFRRINLRKNNEIRDMFLKLGENENADGHCFYSLGNTKVLCTVCGPKSENRGSYSEIGRIRLKVVTFHQKNYDTIYEQRDREIEGLLTEVLNQIIFLDRYRGCCIYIRCVIVIGDGGELSSVLTCISLALMKAGIELRDIISSISVCSLKCLKTNKTYNLVDLDEEELKYYKEKYVVNLITLGICYNSKTVCFFNGTCPSISSSSFAEILNFAEGACRALGDMLKKSIQEHILKKHFKIKNMKLPDNQKGCKRKKMMREGKKNIINTGDVSNDFKRQDTENTDDTFI